VLYNANCAELAVFQSLPIYDTKDTTVQSDLQMPKYIQISIANGQTCPYIQERSTLVDVSRNYMVPKAYFCEEGSLTNRNQTL